MNVKPGDCFLIETNLDGGGHIKHHLFVIILECNADTGETIMVNIETIRSAKADQTVVLGQGDHEFINRPSYVNYSRAKVISLVDLQEKISHGSAIPREPMNEEVTRRICEGVSRSRFIPLGIREIYLDNVYRNL